MADSKLSALNPRGTPDRSNDQIYVINSGAQYRSTINNELGITGSPVGDTDTQSLSNKTLLGASLIGPSINSATLSGTVTGTYTIGGTPTFPASVVTLTGSQTLTNKVLTSPTLTNASITQDSVVGFTTANSGTVYGIAVTSGAISGSSITAASITSTQLATNAVGAANLSTSAITLNYVPITATITTSSTTIVQAGGLTAPVIIPAGGRKVKITVWISAAYTSAGRNRMSLWTGAVGSGTQLTQTDNGTAPSAGPFGALLMAVHTPSAGALTYNVGYFTTSAGTATIEASATIPSFILVEVI